MPEIMEITNEAARGCGYRKKGGIYLIGGDASMMQPCGKLPLPLGICPTCGGGIHQARGWTWVGLNGLFGSVECKKMEDCNAMCPLNAWNLTMVEGETADRAGLLWIGEKFYKTPEDFAKEGIKQGFSRRVMHIPTNFKIGETYVLFAHSKVTGCCPICDPNKPKCTACEGTKRGPGIFSAFRPERIEYILKGDETDEELEKLEKRGLTLIKLVRTDDKDPRNPKQKKSIIDFPAIEEEQGLEALADFPVTEEGEGLESGGDLDIF